MKNLLATMIVLSAFVAHAENNIVEAGKYELASGPKKLCGEVSFAAKDLTGKSLIVAGKYTYQYQNSISVVESDLDPLCEFREENQRQSSEGSSELTLTRVNEEICSEKSVSRTTSIATLRSNEIQIRHEIEGAPAYTCIWKKK